MTTFRRTKDALTKMSLPFTKKYMHQYHNKMRRKPTATTHTDLGNSLSSWLIFEAATSKAVIKPTRDAPQHGPRLRHQG